MKIEDIMKQFTTQQLIHILENSEQQYNKETIEAAQKELKGRRNTPDMEIQGETNNELSEENNDIQKNDSWYYVMKGIKKGPVSKDELLKLYEKKIIYSSTKVWTQGLSEWVEFSSTNLCSEISQPPALVGNDVNNTIVWIIAFAPILGYIIETVVSQIVDNTVESMWYISFGLNTLLCIADEVVLNEAGYRTKKIFKWVFLVPVYLLSRAKILKQRASYLAVWIISFILVCFTPNIIHYVTGISDNSKVMLVREGHLNMYPNKTLGEMIDEYVQNPKWESLVADDGNTYVNVNGKILLGGQYSQMVLQYRINPNSTFDFNALELDGEPQNMLVYMGLISQMYNGNEVTDSYEMSDELDDNLVDSRDRDIEEKNLIENENVSNELLFNNIGEHNIEIYGESVQQGMCEEMSIDIDYDGDDEYFCIERDSPNGLKVLGTDGEWGQNFTYDIELSSAFDEWGELNEKYYVEVGCADLNDDGKSEVIVSIGDKISEMETLIYKASQEIEGYPYTLIGRISGQGYMYLDSNNKIIVPYGGQGLFSTYQYSDGEICVVE